jgi:hypothetical protein
MDMSKVTPLHSDAEPVFPAETSQNDEHCDIQGETVEAQSKSKALFHLRIMEGDIPVIFETFGPDFDLCTQFDGLKWSSFLPVANAVRQLAASFFGLAKEEVIVSQHLRGRGGKGIPRIVFELPLRFFNEVASPEFHSSVDLLLKYLKHGLPTVSGELFSPSEPGLKGEGQEIYERLAMVTAIAQQASAEMGGITLPGRCVVEAPDWQSDALSGALAAKPELEEKPFTGLQLKCDVDGFKKSSRTVYLRPNKQGAASIEFSFDERVWLAKICEFAACDRQLFDAEYDEIRIGTKVKRTLTNLSKITGELF